MSILCFFCVWSAPPLPAFGGLSDYLPTFGHYVQFLTASADDVGLTARPPAFGGRAE
jgi:hypothetical protein